jgi:glycosyltransferase involved in cell wall biosynthesis
LKIALVVPGGVDRSGEARVIPALLALLGRLAAEHEVHVFATDQEPAPGSWMLEGARIHNLGAPRTFWRAASAIRAEHLAKPFDVIHAFWSGRHGALAVGSGALLGVPSVVHVAGGELVALRDIGYGGLRTWHGRLLQSAVLRAATLVTCASLPIVALAAERGVKAERVPLGVDRRRWPARLPVRRTPEETVRLIHVASLNRVKDQRTLLAALRLLAERGRDFHVDVVGEDTLGGQVQALAAKLDLQPRMTFHGFLTQRELRPIVEAAHIAVMSSRHETGPLALLEAAVAGVPTVGTAVGHIAEWNPRAALAVPCADPPALAAALAALIDDEDLRLRIAAEALAHASREDADCTAQRYNEIARHLAAQAKA